MGESNVVRLAIGAVFIVFLPPPNIWRFVVDGALRMIPWIVLVGVGFCSYSILEDCQHLRQRREIPKADRFEKLVWYLGNAYPSPANGIINESFVVALVVAAVFFVFFTPRSFLRFVVDGALRMIPWFGMVVVGFCFCWLLEDYIYFRQRGKALNSNRVVKLILGHQRCTSNDVICCIRIV
jgi:uncharacterized membrane protein